MQDNLQQAPSMTLISMLVCRSEGCLSLLYFIYSTSNDIRFCSLCSHICALMATDATEPTHITNSSSSLVYIYHHSPLSSGFEGTVYPKSNIYLTCNAIYTSGQFCTQTQKIHLKSSTEMSFSRRTSFFVADRKQLW